MTQKPSHLSSIKPADTTSAPAARPMTWAKAHQVAHMAASKAHHTLGVDLSGVSIDVVSALGAADLIVMWRPMPQLFGAYLNEPGVAPGVLINSGLPRPARRYTCAHELGHHWMRHSTSVDDGSSIDTTLHEDIDAVPRGNRRRTWPEQEKLAEAFASWFLMPRRVVTTALDVLNLNRPRTAADVYSLSLLLGTSYRTTVRHLPNLRLATPAQANSWAKVAPGRLKATLDAGVPAPTSRRPDVWALDERFDGLRLPVRPGDRFVIVGPPGVATLGPSSASVPFSTTLLGQISGTPRDGTVYAINDNPAGAELTVTFNRAVTILHIHPSPTGLDPRGAA
jgi:hypothetical protein